MCYSNTEIIMFGYFNPMNVIEHVIVNALAAKLTFVQSPGHTRVL